jgi:hypothetical protein
MHWFAWKPIFAGAVLLGGGWWGYHHYRYYHRGPDYGHHGWSFWGWHDDHDHR